MLQPDGKSLFQNLRIGHPGVGHVALHGIAAVKARPGTGAARDGLIVLEPLIAPDKVVHRALTARQHAQRAVKGVAGRLTDLGVARNHRRVRPGIQHRAFRHDQVQGFQAALVQWDVAAHQCSKNIKNDRSADGEGGIIVAFVLGAGAGKIHRGAARRPVDADLDPDQLALVHRIGHLAVAHPVDDPAHAFLGVVLHMAHIGRDDCGAVSGADLQEFALARLVGRDLRLQVGHVLIGVAAGIAARGQNGPRLRLQQTAAPDKLDIVDDDTLLLQPRAVGRRAARCAPADVGVMAA